MDVNAPQAPPHTPTAPLDTGVRARPRMWEKRWALGGAVVLVPLAQLLALLWLIWNRTPEVPWWDEWETVKIVHTFDQRTISLADFWAFHNEHRIVIPRVLDLGLIEATHWNRQIEMTFDLALAVAAFLLILSCIRHTVHSTKVTLALAAPIGLLALSLAQWEDFLWPFQITFIATVFGAVLCAWALGTRRTGARGFAYALIGALIAALSSFGGLIVWGAFLPSLWLAGYRRVRYFALWLGIAVGVIVPYMHAFPHSATAPPSILDAFAYALAYLGAPASSLGNYYKTPHLLHVQLFAVVSILLTLLNLAVFWLLERTLRPLRAWIGLGLFACGVAAVTALGRGPGLGTAQALTSRYEAFSALWWVAVLAITAATIARLARKISSVQAPTGKQALGALRLANLAFVGIVGVALVIVNVVGFQDGRRWMDLQRQHEGCILQYDSSWNGCLSLYYLPDSIRTLGPYLEQDHLSIFHDRTPLRPATLARVSGSTASFIDTVGPVTIARPHTEPVRIQQGGDPFSVTGWAVDAAADAPAAGVFVFVDGAFTTLAEYGGDRPDVAKARGNPADTKSGFGAVVDTNRLAPGMHTISIGIVSRDRTSYALSPQQVMVAVGPAALAPNISSLSGLSKIPGETRIAFGLPDGRIVAQQNPTPIQLAAGEPLAIDGWAVDTQAESPGAAVFLSVDDARDIRVEYGQVRPDVAQALGNAAYLPSGFRATIPGDTLTVGRHTVTLKVVTADGHAYYAPTERLIVDVR